MMADDDLERRLETAGYGDQRVAQFFRHVIDQVLADDQRAA